VERFCFSLEFFCRWECGSEFGEVARLREIQHHDIWIHRYELKALVPMSSRATSLTRSGALLRIERGPGAPGFSDLHPWPELGDLNLNEQLARLKGNAEAGRTDLLRRALILADLDREAREKNISAFKGLIIPRSHALIQVGPMNGRVVRSRNDLQNLKQMALRHLSLKLATRRRTRAQRSIQCTANF
jgi:hypothetical protein